MAALGWMKPKWEADAIDVAQRAGCYLGEVIVRNLGGRWVPAAETTYAALPGMAAFPLVVELPNGGCCSPLSRPFKLLEHGRDGESMVGFYAGVAALAQEPPPRTAPTPVVAFLGVSWSRRTPRCTGPLSNALRVDRLAPCAAGELFRSATESAPDGGAVTDQCVPCPHAHAAPDRCT